MDGWAVARVAGLQHGTIAHRQLLRLGFSARAIRRRVAGGYLHPLFRGVYAVGHPVVSVNGQRSGAVLATGDGAALSHHSAAALLGMTQSSASVLDTVIATRGGRRRPGIRIHRVTSLDANDVIREQGIPSTSVARTLIDLAAVTSRDRLDRALERAEILRILDLGAATEALARLRGHRGVARFRVALERFLPDSVWTRSELERRFLALCRDAAVPAPLVNSTIEVLGESLEVDFAWPAQMLVIEVDGFETHGTRSAFERDRERAQLLAAAGWRTLGFTWRQIAEPHRALPTLRAIFGRRSNSVRSAHGNRPSAR